MIFLRSVSIAGMSLALDQGPLEDTGTDRHDIESHIVEHQRRRRVRRRVARSLSKLSVDDLTPHSSID